MNRAGGTAQGTSLAWIVFALISSLVDGPAGSLVAQEATSDDKPAAERELSIAELRARSLLALQTGDLQAAMQSADQMMRKAPEEPATMRRAADIYLRSGNAAKAVELFDRSLEKEPQQLPYLWQRGIALYLVGDYRRGAEQFEKHREVNPEDVENAAWHFLCVAKQESIDRAKEMVLPAPNDPRIPMEEVLKMLSSGDTEAVRSKVESVPEDSPRRSDAEFYGDFYLGLYADAQGDRKQALRFLSRAARDAPHHYMGDVARVYAKHLQQADSKR